MKRVAFTLVAALLAGGAVLAPAPAQAQKAKEAPAAKPPKLSKGVQVALGAAQKLQAANDHAGALAKIAEADALPNTTAEDKLWINRLRLASAQATNDKPLTITALKGMIASGMVEPADKLKFLRYIGSVAQENKDYAGAMAVYNELITLEPNNTDNMIGLAELYQAQRLPGKAVATLQDAIAKSLAAGTKPPESWYRRALGIAYDAKLPAETRSSSLLLLGAYPNPVNWRDGIVILQDSFPSIDEQTELDFLRLQAAAGALNGERDFVEYADTALGRGFPGEAQWAIKEGLAKGVLKADKPLVAELKKTADDKVVADRAGLPGLEKEIKGSSRLAVATGDAWYGYGDFAKAAALYKQGIDNVAKEVAAPRPANVPLRTVDLDQANLRLGAALARSGDKAGAKAAFEAVKAGPRQALAQYWMALLVSMPG
ncbi:MAG: tetratricopeptide repeat protein [Sphingomonadales bacterium]